MEEYLLDRDTLGKVIDELMKQRALPIDSTEELNKYREEQMHALDDYVAESLIGGLSETQSASLDELLDRETENPDAFRDFFKEEGLDVDQIVSSAFESFSNNYLKGGQNA